MKKSKNLASLCSIIVLAVVVVMPVSAAKQDLCAEVWQKCRDAGNPAGYCIDLGVVCDALTK